MSDNFTLITSNGPIVFASTDTAGVHTPQVKMAAGTAIAGKVGIDQTTPGTTNAVATPDASSTSGSITAVDAASSSATGLGAQSLVTGTATAGSTVSATMSGASSYSVEVSGTWSATLQVEKSADGGTTWVPVGATPFGSVVPLSSFTANGALHGNAAGCTNIRVRCTAYTSGTASVKIQPGYGVGSLQTVAAAPASYTSAPTVTRPANTTAYTANDVLGGAITFPNVGPPGAHVLITCADLRIDVAAVPSGMTSFRLYLYDATPPSAVADNGAWDLPSGDRANYLGYVDLGTPVDLGSTLVAQATGVNLQVKLAAGVTSLFGYLVSIGGFTPAANSEVYTPRLKTVGV